MLRLGEVAPDFVQESSEGTIYFHPWLDRSWGMLFSHPADFTPVDATELGVVARLAPEFEQLNVKVIALSVDPAALHRRWIDDIQESQRAIVKFPILADVDHKVSALYGLIHPLQSTTQTVRAVFVIDPMRKVRLMHTYPAAVGRNFDEILRVVQALQLADNYSVATPGNWKQGEDVLISPALKDPEMLRRKFPKGYRAVKSYMRFTPQPDLVG